MNNKITIDRTKWLRGKTVDPYLWDKARDAGCCLGHHLIQVDNLSLECMNEIGEPCELEKATSITDRDFYYNSDFADDAISINDNSKINDAEREQELIKLFNENGYELTFIN